MYSSNRAVYRGMNKGADGPRCSLISYVVPPGLSRAPLVEPIDFQFRPSPVEGVSVKHISASLRPTEKAPSITSPPPPQSPREEGSDSVKTAKLNTTSSAAQLKQFVTKPTQKLLVETRTEAQANKPRKSCLSRAPPPAVPARFNLKKKTVAFGKTVNVSQTIEATSRASRKELAMSKSCVAKEGSTNNTENKENEPEEVVKDSKPDTSLLEILKDVKSSLDDLKARDEQRASELKIIQKMVDERGKEVDLLRGMFADYIGKDCLQSSDFKLHTTAANRIETEEVKPTLKQKYEDFPESPSPQRYVKRREGPTRRETMDRKEGSDREEADEITYSEFKRLMARNPALRQFVLDIRNEELDQRKGYPDRRRKPNRAESPRWRDSPNRAERIREAVPEPMKRLDDTKRQGPSGAKFTEKVTVERSIRCSPQELAQYSVDTKRYIEDQLLEQESGDVMSMYCPGESVSYYPEGFRHRGNANDSLASDEDDARGERFNRRNLAVERRRYRRERRTDRY